MTEPLIALDGVQVRRGRRQVLAVPRLAIAPGARLAVVGPNGAGKSTLLEVLALLRRPDAGTVTLGGRRVAWEPGELVRLRRDLAVVFQRPLLLQGTLLDNVALGLRLRGVARPAARAAAQEALTRLGVGHLAGRRGAAVSAGEAQRASVARALVLAPRVLLLDEPFAALDSLARRRLLDDFESLLRDQACAVVLVTHDWREVRRLAEDVLVLFAGEVVQAGPRAAVEAAPATPGVAALIAAGS